MVRVLLLRRGLVPLGLIALINVGIALGAGSARRVGTPTVTGPRSTTSEQPAYRFRAAHAVSFRCSFDSTTLHFCSSRYSQKLAPGKHTLRVRAVGKSGLSRIVTVKVAVTVPYPALNAGAPVDVGAGAGVPAVAAGAAWVPLTGPGQLARVDAAGSVGAKTTVGVPSGGSEGFLDSATVAGGSVWTASDAGGTIARVDPASGAITAKIAAGTRPGGLVVGDDAVWAFGFLGDAVTRVDVGTGAARTLHVSGAIATGLAFGGGSLWLLTTRPSRILEVDPASGAVRRTIDLQAPYAPAYSVIETWWLAYGDSAVWAALPNYGAVARVDAATGAVTYTRTPYGRPFCVAVGGGSAWVATDHGVLRLDGVTAKPTGVALLPSANLSGFASITYADGAAWYTNYDRGTLTRVSG
jgi:streptogramin lyase